MANRDSGLLTMIDTFDRPEKTSITGGKCGFKTYANAFGDKPGEHLPKIGVVASAGMGHARAEWSIFDVEAKGPNVTAGAAASTASLGAEVYAKAELASASARIGPVKAKVGLATDTGYRIGVTGIQAEFLGTGVTIGRTIGFSIFGNGFELNLW